MSEFLNLIPILSDRCGVDFEKYASSSLERRIESIVVRNFKGNTEAFKQYLITIDKNSAIEIINEIAVNTTEFFRDWSVWKIIKSTIPEELGNFNSIRIWHAGCSTGEEVISFAILLSELGFKSRLKIFATDISERAMAIAREGIYKQKVIDQSRENINAIIGIDAFQKYFEIKDGFWKLKHEMLPEFVFKKMDLSKMETYSRYDIILCRNVMIYFNIELQRKVLDLFANSMFNGGFLILGKQENAGLVLDMKGFTGISREERIFRKYE